MVEGRSGGAMTLIADQSIKNNGILSANGSLKGQCGGGTICVSTESEFVNEGVIECRPNGRVYIRCGELYNDGTIVPPPNVYIIENANTEHFDKYPLKS